MSVTNGIFSGIMTFLSIDFAVFCDFDVHNIFDLFINHIQIEKNNAFE